MPLKTPPTKAELREQLREEVRRYLEKGGRVEQVDRGVSGRGDALPVKKVLFDTPRETRTYVTDLIASIDARRRPSPSPHKTAKAKSPRLKTIFDDFGEPLRKVWVEE